MKMIDIKRSFSTAIDEEAAWQAFEARDRNADGRFVVGVVTMGMDCRPSSQGRRQHGRRSVRGRSHADWNLLPPTLSSPKAAARERPFLCQRAGGGEGRAARLPALQAGRGQP